MMPTPISTLRRRALPAAALALALIGLAACGRKGDVTDLRPPPPPPPPTEQPAPGSGG